MGSEMCIRDRSGSRSSEDNILDRCPDGKDGRRGRDGKKKINNKSSSVKNSTNSRGRMDDVDDDNFQGMRDVEANDFVWEDITREDKEKNSSEDNVNIPKNNTSSANMIAAAIARGQGKIVGDALREEKGLVAVDSAPFSSKELRGSTVMQPAGRIPNTIPINHVRSLRIPCLLYTSPSPRDLSTSRMPSSA